MQKINNRYELERISNKPVRRTKTEKIFMLLICTFAVFAWSAIAYNIVVQLSQ